jgi:outer membrane immunogenic protein
MRTLIPTAAIAGVLLSVMPALADGMPSRRGHPAEARPHIGGWSGMYFGNNAGYAWGDVELRDRSGASPYSEYASPDNGILGGHMGIQHQHGRIVVGIEASYSGTGVFGDGWDGGTCRNSAAHRCEGRIDTLFTIGPRLGLAHNFFLFYLTGGYASARVDTRAIETATGVETASASRNDGWYLGAGVEVALQGRWVVGLEYLRVELEDRQQYQRDYVRADGEIDILRARLSFKLGRADQGEPLK